MGALNVMVLGRSSGGMIAERSAHCDLGFKSRQVIMEQTPCFSTDRNTTAHQGFTLGSLPENTTGKVLPGRWTIGRTLALRSKKAGGSSSESAAFDDMMAKMRGMRACVGYARYHASWERKVESGLVGV